MDYGEVIKGLQLGKTYWRSSIAPDHWIQLMKGRFEVGSKKGQSQKYIPSDPDMLATDWKEVTDTKIAKVDVTKETVLKAFCPSCSTAIQIDKVAHEIKAETVITCKCGFVFGVNKVEKVI